MRENLDAEGMDDFDAALEEVSAEELPEVDVQTRLELIAALGGEVAS